MVLSHMGLYMAAATSEFKPHPNGYTRRFPAATRIVTCAPIQELFYLSVVIRGYTHCLQK
jgi:hypothetical protein